MTSFLIHQIKGPHMGKYNTRVIFASPFECLQELEKESEGGITGLLILKSR